MTVPALAVCRAASHSDKIRRQLLPDRLCVSVVRKRFVVVDYRGEQEARLGQGTGAQLSNHQ